MAEEKELSGPDRSAVVTYGGNSSPSLFPFIPNSVCRETSSPFKASVLCSWQLWTEKFSPSSLRLCCSHLLLLQPGVRALRRDLLGSGWFNWGFSSARWARWSRGSIKEHELGPRWGGLVVSCGTVVSLRICREEVGEVAGVREAHQNLRGPVLSGFIPAHLPVQRKTPLSVLRVSHPLIPTLLIPTFFCCSCLQ